MSKRVTVTGQKEEQWKKIEIVNGSGEMYILAHSPCPRSSMAAIIDLTSCILYEAKKGLASANTTLHLQIYLEICKFVSKHKLCTLG